MEASSGKALVGSEKATLATLRALRAIPEEQLWLAGQRTAATRLAYRRDVTGFMTFLGIDSANELREVDRAAVLAWRHALEIAGAQPTTIRRKLAALTSLFTHLVGQRLLVLNPCREVLRPAVEREGSTAAFSVAQARLLLDAPDPATARGVRDRALLSVGFQTGARRASIAGLRVRDLHQDRGHDVLRFRWKGGRAHTVALHPETARRLRDYMAGAGIGSDLDGPLFRPGRGRTLLRRHLAPKMVDWTLKRYCRELGIEGRFSAHSMRATFITTALENGASLEDVQEAAGHADPATTKLYDRRRYNPERSAAFRTSY